MKHKKRADQERLSNRIGKAEVRRISAAIATALQLDSRATLGRLLAVANENGARAALEDAERVVQETVAGLVDECADMVCSRVHVERAKVVSSLQRTAYATAVAAKDVQSAMRAAVEFLIAAPGNLRDIQGEYNPGMAAPENVFRQGTGGGHWNKKKGSTFS